jgi:hypothetical protein
MDIGNKVNFVFFTHTIFLESTVNAGEGLRKMFWRVLVGDVTDKIDGITSTIYNEFGNGHR